MANELQVRYASEVDKILRLNLIFKKGVTCHGRFEGDPKAGMVKVPTRGEMVVGNYDKVAGGTLNESSTTYIDVAMDQDLYVNELIDGFDAAAVPDNIVANRIESAAFSLQYAYQKKAIAELEANGKKATDTTATTESTAYKALLAAKAALTKAGVPASGRVALVSSDFMTNVMLDSHYIKQGDLAQKYADTGASGMIAGFLIFEAPDLAATTEFVAYHFDWFAEIDEWRVLPHIQDLGGSGTHIGASAVQGRKICKYKLTKPEAAYVKTTA